MHPCTLARAPCPAPWHYLHSCTLTVILSYDSYMRFQLNFKSGKAVYLQLVDQVKLAAAAGALQPGEAAARDPPACRRPARQPQHRRESLRRAREPGHHRDRRRQGLLRPRAGRSPFRKDVRRKLLAEMIDDLVDPRAPPADRRDGIPPTRRRAIRRAAAQARARLADLIRAATTTMSDDDPMIDVRGLVRRFGRD